jgi:hypothetical protein
LGKKPRWGWSGVSKIDRPPSSEAELKSIIDLLPRLRSPVEEIVAELQAIGGRYSRYLHQDEFGPTRAERMQAIREILVPLDELASRFGSLPPHLGLLLSEELLGYVSVTEQLDPNRFNSYSADKAQIDALSDRMSDIHQSLLKGNRTSDATLIEGVSITAGRLIFLLCNLDTTAEANVVFDGPCTDLPETNNSTDPLVAASAAIDRMRSRFDLALSRLRRGRGTEVRVSFIWLVRQLCDLWRRETGSPVTVNPVKEGAYTGRPQSAAGRFVCAAAEALQPVSAWVDEHRLPDPPLRAEVITRPPGFRVQAVHSAMRGYIADANSTDSAVPRRGRPRKK